MVKFNTSVHITKGTLDYVHADLWGPSRKPSFGGACYILTIIDDYSRRVWAYFLKNKDDTFAAFTECGLVLVALIYCLRIKGCLLSNLFQESQRISLES